MPKVYGIGTFDFRRHRVAEYAADNLNFDPPPPPPESIPSSTLSSSITLVEIQRDRLTKIAAANWLKTAGSESPSDRKFDPELVKEIYESELLVSGGRKTVPLQRVMILEVSQYLENYLWPNFDPETATFEHVMSMILMVNEKFRENVAAWICFYDRRDAFKGFLQRVLRLKEQGRTLNIVEKTNYLLFMINAFQSLEDEIVSETVLKLVSLQLWHCLSFGRFQMELCLNPQLIKKWKKLTKREAKEARKAGHPFDPSKLLEVTFLRNLIEEFLEILDSKVILQRQIDNEDQQKELDDEKDHFDDPYVVQIDDSCLLYCERFMEFLIDLLSQLPTRRFLKAVVADVSVVAKCHLSALYLHEKGRLFAQLVDLLQFYEGFEIDDHVGTQLSDDDVLLSHYSRLQAFQLLAFKQIPKLRDLAMCHIGAIHKRADLSKKLSVLSSEELHDLVCNKLKLVSDQDPCAERVDFLIEVMVSFFEKRQSQKEAINALPLYPNEKIMWNESLVPSINYSGEGCLALPKLNLQFLTLHDYLLRNFNLFRLESTYEIREDIQEAVPHLLAYINNEGETAFRGWSRMAVPIKEFRITEVKQPNIGEVKPSSVTARVTYSISSYKSHIRSEWDALKEHDVLFLLSIRPSFKPLSAEEAAKHTVPERLGLEYVRGCEVIEICDEEGVLMNDFTGRIKRDEWKPPKGELRTVTIALDTAQYHMDVTEKGAENAYESFNILMRRKPKENNFKAILESIRDLMNESCIVPDWLHNIFLPRPPLTPYLGFRDRIPKQYHHRSGLSLIMSRVYVGNLDPRVSERELEDEFRTYGVIRSIWVARKPPGYAFIDFDDRRDAMDAIRDLDGKHGWRVELSHNSRGSGGGGGGGRGGRGGRERGGGGSDLKCYECGEPGHFARECRLRVGSGGLGSGRRRSRTPPRYRRSPSYGRRSLSPRGRSPRRRSVSPPRGRSRSRSYSKSPPYKRGRDESPAYKRALDESPAYANGNSAVKERQRSRS